MIEKILISHQTVMNDNNLKVLVTNMRLNFEYYIKVQIMAIEDITEEFVSCQLRIINMSKAREELLLHKFYNKCSIKFNCVNILPVYNENCWVGIQVAFPLNIECIFLIELIEIKKYIINELNLEQTRKNELFKIIDSYVKGDYDEAINKMSILGEFIAKELANKIEKKNRDFRGAINTLTNYNISEKKDKDFRGAINELTIYKIYEKKKINYNFFGSLLTPIYFVRNQKLHPYSKLGFDKSLSEMLFINLSRVIDNLHENQIKL